MANGSAAPVTAGLAVGIAFIILFSTVGTNVLSHYPRYNLGEKDELVSRLSEYFGRESDNAAAVVRITNGTYYDASLAGGQDIYAYGLAAEHDDKAHGVMRIVTYPNEMRVHMISIEWRHNGDPNLRDAADLMASGIADYAIPD